MNIPIQRRYAAPKKASAYKVRMAWEAFQAGKTAAECATELGISVSGLRQRWVRTGFYVPVPVAPLRTSEVKEMVRMAESGNFTVRKIAEVLGRNEQHVAETLRKRGVRRPRMGAKETIDRDRKVVALLIDGRTWPEVIEAVGEAGPASRSRNRLLQAALRYCEREGIAVPAGAMATLRPGNWSRRGNRPMAAEL